MVLSQIIQVGATSTALEISVVATCVAIPFLVCVASIYEFFLFLGPQCYPYATHPRFVAIMQIMFVLAGLALCISIGAAAWYLSHTAFWCFLLSSVVAMTIAAAFMESLNQWWHIVVSRGPGSEEKGKDGS